MKDVLDEINHVCMGKKSNDFSLITDTNTGETMEVWGNGLQTRSFLYIDECVEAVWRLMGSNFTKPVNIGSEEMISINNFAQMAIDISGKDIHINNLEGEAFKKKYGFPTPLGVKGRNSDNRLFKEKIGWETKKSLIEGMTQTYSWIKSQVIGEI